MVQYLLTTDTIAPVDFETYVAFQQEAFGGEIDRAIGAWLPKFGTPNQMSLIQEVLPLADLPAPPAIGTGVRLLGRVQQLVDVIRPFPTALQGRSLCELRTYRIAPEHWTTFLELKTAILPVREGYSPNFGVFAATTGQCCRIMHLWGYKSLEERDAVRAMLKVDTAWGSYIAQILPMIVEMQSILVTPMLPPQHQD